MSDTVKAGDRVQWKRRGVVRTGQVIMAADRNRYVCIQFDGGNTHWVPRRRLTKIETQAQP